MKKEMLCKQKGNTYSRQKEHQISEHPHAFTGCQNVIPSTNHPEDTPLFCNDYKLCIELEVESKGSTGGVGVMSTVMLYFLMRGKVGEKERVRDRERGNVKQREKGRKITRVDDLYDVPKHEKLIVVDSKKEIMVFW